jgi:amidase
MPYPRVPVPHAGTGPLAGLSFGVKDLFHVAGYPTSGGQPIAAGAAGRAAAHRADGAEAAGCRRALRRQDRHRRTRVLDERAERALRIARQRRGAAAHHGWLVLGIGVGGVVNGLCDFALGTDTGGSVRAPASHCGLVGLRPTHGRVSLQDALDLSPSFDTCGWFARDVPTFARVADVLLGDDPCVLPGNVRLLAPTDLWALATPAAVDALAPVRSRIEDIVGPATPVKAVLDDPATRDVLAVPLRPGLRSLAGGWAPSSRASPRLWDRTWRSASPGVPK